MDDWHLDRKVTLGIIVALMINAGSSMWWASKLDTTVSHHTLQIEANRANIDKARDYQYKIGSRLSKIEANQKFQKEILTDIKRKVSE